LSPTGKRQAKILADYLASLGIQFDAVYSGEMERQKDTAKPVIEALYGVGGKPVLNAPEFNEYDAHTIISYQAPEMMSEDPEMAEALPKLTTDGGALALVFQRAMLRWVRGERHIPGVETWPEFTQRVYSGLERIFKENGPKKTIAIFTSGGAISITLRKALGLSDEQTILMPLQTLNTGISLFHFKDNVLTLSYFNCIAHLEMRREPGLITYR
jgi:broad specificity phosphatase PhoE